MSEHGSEERPEVIGVEPDAPVEPSATGVAVGPVDDAPDVEVAELRIEEDEEEADGTTS